MTRRLVLDASAAMEVLLGLPAAAPILDLLERSDLVAVPELFAAEVGNALWKYVRSGELPAEEVPDLLELAMALADEATPIQDLAVEALDVACAFGHPVYDCLYAVLARRRAATVCTLDRRLRQLLDAMRVPAAPDPLPRPGRPDPA